MTALKNVLARWGNHHRGSTAAPLSGRAREEGGFTIIETTVAMAIVFVVLTGTLATFSASVRNLVTGRQRTGAVALARAVIEDARSSPYDQVGHALSNDSTLAGDSNVTGNPKTYEDEPLVGVTTSIFPQHTYAKTDDTGIFTVNAYVTWVDPGTADPFKRLTVVVSWASAQYDTTSISNRVRLSSFLFEAGVPPDPMVDGAGDVDGGMVEVTGTFEGIDLRRGAFVNPGVGGVLNSLFLRKASGTARSASGALEVNTGSVTGCNVDASGTATECGGIVAETSADSDATTSLPEHESEGPIYDVGHTATANSVLSLSMGSNDSVATRSTARSCFTCFTSSIGDDDRLAYHGGESMGPTTSSMGFAVGSVGGNIVQMNGASQATTTLDHDTVGTTQRLGVTSRLQMPSIDVVTVEGAPPGFVAAVQVSAVDVTATAGAGPSSTAPTVAGEAVTVETWDTLGGGSLGYRTITVTPGDEKEDTAQSTFNVGSASVSLTTTVEAGGKSTSSTTDTGGNITYAEASLTNWLRITVVVEITGAGGEILANGTVTLDYGRIAARALWEAA